MMKRVHMPALLVMAGGLLWQPPAGAANPTATITITGTVVSKTCTFNDATPPVIDLGDINTRAFTDADIKKEVNVPVAITCGAGVSTVKIVPKGTPDTADTTAFKNTGDSTGVALRFTDASGNALLPNGSKTVSVIPTGSSGNKPGSYTFKAGYVATAPGAVTGGSFASQVTLSFSYN